jgi:hypothetical protein
VFEEREEAMKTIGLVVRMCLAVLAITGLWWLSYVLISAHFGKPPTASDLGQMFGAIGALFSGWAFCGMLWAIFLQHKAIEIQRKDLAATIEEMRQSRRAQENSAEHLRVQGESVRLQGRVQALSTLITVPLQVKSSTFLHEYLQQVGPVNHSFQANLEELSQIAQELRTLDEKVIKEGSPTGMAESQSQPREEPER